MVSRYLVRLYGGFALVTVLATFGLWMLCSAWIRRDTLAHIEQSLEVRAEMLRAMLGPDPRALELPEAVIRRLGEATATRFTLVDAAGNVILDSRVAGLVGNHADRPEIVAALRSGRGAAIRHSDSVGVRLGYVALRVGPAAAPVGVVRAACELTLVEQRLGQLRRILLLATGTFMVLALGLCIVMTRRVLRPVVRMTRMAGAIAAGSGAPLASDRSQDEIGDLSRALSSMAERLRERLELLRAERNKLVAILASMVEGVVAVDRREQILHANEAAARMLAIGPGDLPGRSLLEVTRVPGVAAAVRRCLGDGHTVQEEITLAGTRSDQILELTASPLRDGSGAVTGAVLVLHDLTTLRHLETVRRDFVANVSHELKTPLAAVRGFIETLDDDPQMPAEVQRRFLLKARQQVERLTALVSDLLVLSRLETGDPHEIREPCELGQAVQHAVEGCAEALKQRRLRLETVLPGRPAEVSADEEYLRQIIDNLLSNAIRYTPEGGRIWIRVREQSGSWILEVEDTGIGIESDEQQRIFERFFRVDRARSRGLGGTGLGLAIVKHAVERLGGEVTLESQPGKGSCFRVRIPQADQR